MSMTGDRGNPVPTTVPSWLKPVSSFGLLLLTTFIESLHIFTIPSILSRLRIVLADTPSPRGSGASRVTVGTFVRGLLTARYLAAVPRRILLMEQQVWSVRTARQSTLRPRVAATAKAGGFM